MGATRIEWSDRVWNPVTGCTPVSAGCEHCYARRMANRLRGRFGYPADDPFRVTVHPERFDEPLRWRKPARVFVCSMGDMFHDDVPSKTIVEVFDVMAHAGHATYGLRHLSITHTFMVLTKRPDRMMAELSSWWVPAPNVWLGVSVEDQRAADERIPLLLRTPAAVRFVSVEPMLGPVDLVASCGGPTGGAPLTWVAGAPDGDGIRWVICGGETGPRARPIQTAWVRSLRDQCQSAGVPFFLKSMGPSLWTLGRTIDGRTWEEFPEVKG
jgi:protein gp37